MLKKLLTTSKERSFKTQPSQQQQGHSPPITPALSAPAPSSRRHADGRDSETGAAAGVGLGPSIQHNLEFSSSTNPMFDGPAEHQGSSNAGPTPFSQQQALPVLNMEEWFRNGVWLSINLKQARDLKAHDYDTQSSDPYAKMSVKMPGLKSAIVEHRTRTVHRNLFPIFDERLLCPLTGLTKDCVFTLLMYDADWMGADFMGQVGITLGHFLEAMDPADMQKPVVQWHRLVRNKSTMRRHASSSDGELQLEVQILSFAQAEEARRSQEQYRRPDFLGAKFIDSQLELSLHGVKFLRRIRDPKVVNNLLKKASIELRVGQTMIRHEINARAVNEQDMPLELEMQEKIVIPLSTSFSGFILAWDKKATSEIADVKIYLCIGSEQMCKTQVPLWVVPDQEEDEDKSEYASEAEHEEEPPPSPSPTKIGGQSSLSSLWRSGVISRRQTSEETSPGPKAHERDSSETSEVIESKPTPAFVRTMEKYTKTLPKCNIEFDLKIVPIKGEDAADSKGGAAGGSSGACTVLDISEDQEDVRDAPPLANVPSPLETMIMDKNFPCGPCRLYQLLFKPGSLVTEGVAQKEGLTKMEVSQWEAGGSVNSKPTRKRIVKYTKPLTIPIPFAPKICDVTEVHTMLIQEVSGFVCEIAITTDAPKGDSFKVVQQVVAQRGTSAGSCDLRVSMMIEWLKSPGLLKNPITQGSIKDTTKHWQEEMATALNSHLAGTADAPASTALVTTNIATPAPANISGTILAWLSVVGAVLVLMILVLVLVSMWQSGFTIVETNQQLVVALDSIVSSQQQLVQLQAHVLSSAFTCPEAGSTAAGADAAEA